MAKIDKYTKRSASNIRVSDGREAPPHVMVNRKSRDRSAPGLISVKFMELRPSMCRWPIGDPQHFETFRFCGSACSSGASYCKTHNAIAHSLSRPGTSRKTDFQMRLRVA
jgi:hypothetical protein